MGARRVTFTVCSRARSWELPLLREQGQAATRWAVPRLLSGAGVTVCNVQRTIRKMIRTTFPFYGAMSRLLLCSPSVPTPCPFHTPRNYKHLDFGEPQGVTVTLPFGEACAGAYTTSRDDAD